MNTKRGFASDNNAGVHIDILSALAKVNNGHVVAYGDDSYTQDAVKSIKILFINDPDVFFVFTGTGANVLALQSMGHSFNSIICANTAHINVDECGAPEKFTGMKTIPVFTNNGKLTLENISPYVHGFGFEHHAQPGIVSITQPTELGTLYTFDEIKVLADFVHKNNMYLHMDGARISNAVATLNIPIADITEKAGVDVLSFGGTKNGLMYGEAIVFFNKDLATHFKYYRKQGMQLASKMRYVAAQFSAFLSNNLWIENARHANQMAKLLAESVQNISGIKITQKVEANGVFAIVPNVIIPILQKEFFFYVWDEITGEVRWMCSFDTTEDDVKAFSKVLNKLMIEYNNGTTEV